MYQDATWYIGRPRPRPQCVRWGPSSPPKKRHSPPIFGPCLLWPDSWMDQDATWYGDRHRPRPHCARWEPNSDPHKKGAQPPIFGPCPLWPNGCMHQDTSWYGGRSQSRRHCVRWGPSSPPLKGHSPQFSAHVRCGQTAGWTKMPLGMELGLGPGDFVLDGDPLPQWRIQKFSLGGHMASAGAEAYN